MSPEQMRVKIKELERRVKELEARPPEMHYHYHPAVVAPVLPSTSPSYPWTPAPLPVTCMSGGH